MSSENTFEYSLVWVTSLRRTLINAKIEFMPVELEDPIHKKPNCRKTKKERRDGVQINISPSHHHIETEKPPTDHSHGKPCTMPS
jgi:hypothetical protein